MEKEYAVLFEKEYNEFIASDHYKTFGERYKLLCDLSQKIDSSENVDIYDMPMDTICINPNEEKTDSQQTWEGLDVEIKVKPFYEYKNLSGIINTVIVAQEFYIPSEMLSQFNTETEIHDAYAMTDKDAFLASADLNNETAYYELCMKRILVDKVNHSKYFMILKMDHFTPWELVDNLTYNPGIYDGTLYVYDIGVNKFVRSIHINATNSGTIQSMDYATANELDKDLGRNISASIRGAIVPFKGGVPAFNINSLLIKASDEISAQPEEFIPAGTSAPTL